MWEVVGSYPGRTNNQGLKKNWWDHAGCDLRTFLSSDDCVIGWWHWAVCLVSFILLSLVKSKGTKKSQHYCSKKSISPVVWSTLHASRIVRNYHGLWVGYSKLISGLIAAASGALVCWCLSLDITWRGHALLSSNPQNYITLHCWMPPMRPVHT